jgi:CO/xanthine dehydrogenase Mo-binding subunit
LSWSTFHIPARHQGYLEPHAAVVAIDNDGRIKCRCRRKIRSGFAASSPKRCVSGGRIRINVVNVGGEFGGKGDASDYRGLFPRAGVGRPVKMVMTYAEELTASNPHTRLSSPFAAA